MVRISSMELSSWLFKWKAELPEMMMAGMEMMAMIAVMVTMMIKAAKMWTLAVRWASTIFILLNLCCPLSFAVVIIVTHTAGNSLREDEQLAQALRRSGWIQFSLQWTLSFWSLGWAPQGSQPPWGRAPCWGRSCQREALLVDEHDLTYFSGTWEWACPSAGKHVTGSDSPSVEEMVPLRGCFLEGEFAHL